MDKLTEKQAKEKGAAHQITAKFEGKEVTAYLRKHTFEDVAAAVGAAQTNPLLSNKVYFERTAIREITDPVFFTETDVLLQACAVIDGIVKYEGAAIKKL